MHINDINLDLEYALRYGRLNSSRSIKWEDEIKEFFTEQLTKDDVYSLSVFTILGSYLHQLQFLDEQWVGDNFNKIFPLGNEQLWQASITAYFFRTNVVYVETYNLFKSNKLSLPYLNAYSISACNTFPLIEFKT
jgi:hypothetical protein